MSQQQDNQERGRKILSRTFLVRVVAVLLFVALGSFAVFQSVLGDKLSALTAAKTGTTSEAGATPDAGEATKNPELAEKEVPVQPPLATVVPTLSPPTKLASFSAGESTEPKPRTKQQEPASKPPANPAGESRFASGKTGLPEPKAPDVVLPNNDKPAKADPVANTKLPDLARPADNPAQLSAQTAGARIQKEAEAVGASLKGSSDNLLDQANAISGKFGTPETASPNSAETKQPAINPFPTNPQFENARQETPVATTEEPRTQPQQNPAPIRTVPGAQPGPFSPQPATTQQTTLPNQLPGQTHNQPVAGPNPTAIQNRQLFNNGATELPSGNANNTPVTPAATNSLIPAAPRTSLGGGSPMPGSIPAGALATPGETSLEGVQSPALAIEKIAPREIQVNQPAKFRIVVRNVGRVPASDVRVFDRIPAGTELISSNPQPDNKAGGDGLSWSLGDLPAGQEKSIEMELRPTRAGEIGSVAQVTFASQASMRTRVTRPELGIEHTAPAQVMIGSPVSLQITARNNGDGPATNVIIQEKVPEQLRYNAGIRDLEYEIGTLAPGQSRSITLTLQSAAVGQFRNVVGVVGDGGLNASHETTIEVVSPALATSTDGPHRRFLKRETSHTLSVKNNGTAIATNLDLIAQLPRSLRFVSANNQGQYDPGSHAIYWSLAELRPGLSAAVELQTQPVETGNSQIEFTARADLDQKSTVQHEISIEHLVDIYFEIDDVTDHIETGTVTEYRLRIVNQGTKPASNVRLLGEFDSGIRPDSVSGGLRGQARGQQVEFEPIPNINPGEEITATILATGVTAGEHRVAVNLQTDGREINITKEESTRVYADR